MKNIRTLLIKENKDIPPRKNIVQPPKLNNIIRRNQPVSLNIMNIKSLKNVQKPSEYNLQTILKQLESIDFECPNFQLIQQQFMNAIKNYVYFVGFKPVSYSEEVTLPFDGKFIVMWCKLLKKNPYVNSRMIFSKIYEQCHDKLTSNAESFHGYVKQLLSQKNKSAFDAVGTQITPHKPLTPVRSITPIKAAIPFASDDIKQISRKKVIPFDEYIKQVPKTMNSAKKSETSGIQYPDLDEIKEVQIPIDKQKEKFMGQSDKFLMDYLEIDDVYFLRELTIVGILEEDYKKLGCYIIMLVKLKSEKQNEKPKEFYCIAQLRHIDSHDINVLKQIENKYLIEGYILREQGVDYHSYMMSGLEYD